VLTAEQKLSWQENGYVIVRGLFSPAEVAAYRDHFMALNAGGADASRHVADPKPGDPLLKYPRMIHMHRWDQTSLDFMIDPRLCAAMVDLVGKEPYAVQTMFYFKPAGARGQALHQDNYYLRVQPGTCLAAWLAVDRCDEENGCLQLVPGSHKWPLLCTVRANTQESFTDVTVPIPEGTQVEPAVMDPGDVLFFNGSVVHGSFPNRSTDRFRRSLIAHYIEGDAQQVGTWYHPALRMDGTPVELETSPKGMRCGTWVSTDGAPEVELTGFEIVEKVSE
jgi:ectoine hydroxylase-related dioxygenase (phytanoyl-CoA dioxygenase family)